MTDQTTKEREKFSAADSSRAWRFSLHDLMLAMTVVALYVAAFGAILRARPSWADETILEVFAIGCFAITMTIIAYRAACRHAAGRVLISLPRKPNRRVWFVQAAFAPVVVLAIYFLFGNSLAQIRSDTTIFHGDPNWRLYVAVGSVTALVISGLLVAWMAAARKIDLCENGVLYDGLFFTRRWQKIKPGKYHINEEGDLSLTYTWERIIAFIPNEQRDAVEAMLKEKLGDRLTSQADTRQPDVEIREI